MANLIGTIIGIAFCALLLAAGANFIAPKAFVEHNQAAANTAQVSALLTDYSKLAIATGHRPTYADYASVYAGGSTANATYTNSGGSITTSATMAYTNANGQSVPIGTWKFMPGCGVANGPQDCFCLTVPAGATDVTYQATRISAYNQMNSGTQSRIEYSTDKCASGAPVTNPVVCGADSKAGTCWPSATPKTAYYLTVRLNSTGPGSTTDGSGPSGPSSTPIDGVCTTKDSCASGTLANEQTIPGAYTTYTWDCLGSAGGQDDKGGGCSATDGSCSTLDTCLSPGTEVNGANNATGPTWTCNGTNGGSAASCQAANGLCSTTTPNTCAEGTLITVPPSTITATGDIWGCAGSNGGSSQTGCTSTNGICSTTSPGTCTSGSPSNAVSNANGETWYCNGSNGGTSQTNCTSTNGVCSPTALGACTSGTASATSTTVSPTGTSTTTWSCSGANGGSAASPSCSATNAVCNLTYPVGNCLSGTATAVSTSGTESTWTCVGTYGSNAPCTEATTPPTPAACGPTVDTCLPASATEINFGTILGVTYWFCHGTDGGYVSCSDHIGICGSSADTCAQGTPSGQSDSGGYTTWVCNSPDGGSPSPQCSVPDGACNDAQQYGCAGGVTAINQNDNGTTSTWNCPAPNNDGGATSGQCSFADPIKGACNDAVQYGCTAGTPVSESDNGTTSTWICDGSNGGSNSGQCSFADTPASCDCGGTIYSSGSTWSTDSSFTVTPVRCDPSDHGGFLVDDFTFSSIANICTNGTVSSVLVTYITDTSCSGQVTETRTDTPVSPPSCTPVSGGGTPTPVNGACGATAPNCSSGTLDPASVTDSGGNTTWVCDGSNGGTNSPQCSVPDGACNDAQQYGCAGGVTAINQNDNGTTSTWNCPAPNNDGGATSGQCSIADTPASCDCGGTIYSSGSTWSTDDQTSNEPCTQCDPSDHGGFQLCGTTSTGNINTCTNGVVTSTYETVTCVPHCNQSSTCTTTTTPVSPPSCTPVSGGGTPTPVNGTCGATAPNCSSGTLDPTSVADSGGNTTWVCDGSNGGTNSPQCSVPDGACNDAQQYGCAGGVTAINQNDNGTTSTWNCPAPNNDGGSTSGQCSFADQITVNPVCATFPDNVIVDQSDILCLAGTLAPGSFYTTTPQPPHCAVYSYWTCNGSGSLAVDCQTEDETNGCK